MPENPKRKLLYYPQAHGILSIVFDGFGENDADTTPRIIPVRPSQATVVRNSYRQADSWDITFQRDDFPMDPQMIRTGQIQLWLYASKSLESQRLVATNGSLDVPVIPRSLIEASQEESETKGANGVDNAKGVKGAKIKRPTIAGLFDEHNVELSASGEWVTIHGQDYTALLLAKQWPPMPSGRARKIPVGKRLDVTLREMLSDADPTGRMQLIVEGIKTSDIPKVRNESRTNKRGIPVEQDTSFWDIMYKLAIRYGLILFVRGVEVVLARPFNIGSHNVDRVRSMAWGKNIESLSMSRKMGAETAPSIIVQGYDEKRKKTNSAEYPAGALAKVKAGARTTKVTGGGLGKERKDGTRKKGTTNIKHNEEYQIVPAWGISDPKVLKEMARSLHTLLGKAERTVRFRTKDLTDLQDKDLMDMATGDGFSIDIAEWIKDQAAIKNSDLGLPQRLAYLESRGYKPAIALLVAQKYSQIEYLKRPLRVREVTYEYSVTDGISIEAELVDFIVVDGIRDKSAKVPRKSKERLAKTTGEPLVSRSKRDAQRKQHQ